MAKPDGGPAFPSIESEYAGAAVLSDEQDKPYTHVRSVGGMTLRDYFAGQALTGLVLACCIANTELLGPGKAASAAYEFADAMIAQREKD
jgi:hypothetical protein